MTTGRVALVVALGAAAVMLTLSRRTLLRATADEGRPDAKALRVAVGWDAAAVASLLAGGLVFGLGS